MTQEQRRNYLIKKLLNERTEYVKTVIPSGEDEQKNLLRSLMNIRMPMAVTEDFLKIQNEYLQKEIASKGITEFENLQPTEHDLYLWQGDITTLACDAIVNACNSAMLGCFYPCHGCIDNAIHTFSGVQLRLACSEIMKEQGRREETGKAKITPAYNLPCKYVLHTVGPIVYGKLTARQCEQLASCYRSCLSLAEQNGVKSIAFPCISTGEFRFPNEEAAKTAIKAVTEYKAQTNSQIRVIFNVFKDKDYEIYRELLG